MKSIVFEVDIRNYGRSIIRTVVRISRNGPDALVLCMKNIVLYIIAY